MPSALRLPSSAPVIALTATELGGSPTVPMLRALADLAKGPAFSRPDGTFRSEQPGRIVIRKRTVHALHNRRWCERERIAPGVWRAEITQAGRAFFLNHPLRRELAVTL